MRFWRAYVGEDRLTDAQRAMIPAKEAAGADALARMHRHLEGRNWLVGESASLADVCLFAYTHVAGEGGFDLGPYPAIGMWLDRVARLPGFVTIEAF